MATAFEIGMRELDQRSNDGIDVKLLWDPRTDSLFVAVDDERRGTSLRICVDAAHALDAFHHPYAYADRECAEALAVAA